MTSNQKIIFLFLVSSVSFSILPVFPEDGKAASKTFSIQQMDDYRPQADAPAAVQERPPADIEADPPDWLVLLADDLIRRVPSPTSWAWDWGEGVMLYGLWEAYESTSKSSYLNYIRSYADKYVDADGNISAHVSNSAYVNHVAPGILLIHLYEKTGDARYLKAANTIADYVVHQVTRTSNGALAHTYNDELWIDTLFMACVFLARMGALTGDAAFFDEAVFQIFAHAEKMYDEEAHLFYHGWDENGSAAWSDPVTHRSSCFWARGNGWAAAAMVEVLEWLPDGHAGKGGLESLAAEFLTAAAGLQHPTSGLWYTVMDQAGRSGNYLETSASALFVYAVQKGICLGLLDPALQEICNRGNQGLNTRISKPGTDVVVNSISEGTVVGDYSYYITRALRNNLTWGIGAFLMEKTFFRPGNHPPERVENLVISEAGPYVNLSWSPVLTDVRGQFLSSVSYRIYRSEDPCFRTGGIDSTEVGSAVSFREESAASIGNPLRNGFYRIRALNAKGMLSEPSVSVGEFDQLLSPIPDKTDFHFISLPFSQPPAADAQSLVAAVANSNSAAFWDAAGQGYIQYLPKLPETNFPVYSWNSYFLNVTADAMVSRHGEWSPCGYTLLASGGKTHFNAVMMPFEKTEIHDAGDLIQDIPGCNGAAFWDAGQQGYVQYSPSVPGSVNFPVHPGLAYLVHATQTVVWPDGVLGRPELPPRLLVDAGDPVRAPHLVWGMWEEASGKGDSLLSWIKERPGEILTSNSPGCLLGNQGWLVQCASFASPWKAGETCMVTIFLENGLVQQWSALLSWEPSDEAAPTEHSASPSAGHGSGTMPFLLLESYPNPFNTVTCMLIHTDSPGRVRLDVLDLSGRRIRRLADGTAGPGMTRLFWDGCDSSGRRVPSGVYIAWLQQENGGRISRKLVLAQ